MQSIHLTNVRREDDATTKTLRTALRPAVDMYNGLEPHQRDHIAALIMFHCGLYRTFGTKECIRQLGFIHMNAWDKAAQEKVVAICMSLWRRGIANFTRAYGPARIYRSRETHARRHVHGESFARALFQEVCQTQLAGLWASRFSIVTAAARGSWQELVQAIMRVPQYGGTGFRAKELAQDLLWTPLMCSWNVTKCVWETRCHDASSWCPVGPGARRGLNRLKGRPIAQDCFSSSSAVQARFLAELMDVYNQEPERAHQRPVVGLH
ncbi:unnamed protein product [Cladocopium goreaui]|uniref:5-hmdU DNA kinase helical domain-containing protein n=1 Tax=Cladocopium goreaui TaxID=2562237 RepID=A0A9P1CPL4_9DINO|nr:unnamed protein product [Cladocopium goreaui]